MHSINDPETGEPVIADWQPTYSTDFVELGGRAYWALLPVGVNHWEGGDEE